MLRSVHKNFRHWQNSVYRESDQRLSRIEALQALTQQQIDSNARSIAAWESRFIEIEEETQEATSSTRADLSERIDGQSKQIEALQRQADDGLDPI